ncbi:MAG: GGDEF domain-containing protein [Rubrivivax sp.]
MTTPPDTTTRDDGIDDAVDRALSLVIAQGDQAARLAAGVCADAAAAPARRARAHAVRALVALREGSTQDGLAELAAAEALPAAARDARTADLLQHVRAMWHRREGRQPEAEALLRALHERAAQRPDVDAYLSAAALAIVLSMRGDDGGALDHFYQALALARRSGVDTLLVNALNNLGSTQSDLYNLEDALPLLDECLRRARVLGSRRQIIYAAGNLVQCLCLMGQTAQALAVAREHLIGHIRPEDPPALQRDEEIAHVLFENGLIDEAEAVLGRQAQVDPFSNELATARVWLQARLLLARGDASTALALCLARQRHLDASAEAGTLAIDRVNLLRLAAQAADRTGDAASAYQLLQRAFATHEQLLGRAARSRQLSLQIAHRLRQAEWDRDAAQRSAAQLEALNAALQARVAEVERLQRRLRAQALEDPLTGLFNRRHLQDAGDALLRAAWRRGDAATVAVVDLDFFKQVNDRHGHDVGDRVLCAFAELARSVLRADDLICRYGGEEFALLLPGARAEQAAERLRTLAQRFRALRFDGARGEPFGCSFSAGVAQAMDDEALAALLRRADIALYAAKKGGRDRVEVYEALTR